MFHNSLREIQSAMKWPPTTQEIVETNDDINTIFFNLIAWIVHPRGQITNDEKVMLHKSKAQKVLQITQNITALLPSTLPSKENGQKTRSNDVVDTLNRLGYGTSSC